MKKLLSIDPGKTALLFVDLQEEHRRDDRYLVEGFERVVENAQRLQRTARQAQIPVFHSAYVVDAESAAAKPFHPVLADGTSAFSDASDPNSALCREVSPLHDEILLNKIAASVFSNEMAAPLLRARGVEWIVVAGVWSEACVAATVQDAIALGFRVLLVKDACGSGSAAMHQTAIINLANRLYGGAVVDSERACCLMAGQAVGAWQLEGSVPFRFTYETAANIYDEL